MYADSFKRFFRSKRVRLGLSAVFGLIGIYILAQVVATAAYLLITNNNTSVRLSAAEGFVVSLAFGATLLLGAYGLARAGTRSTKEALKSLGLKRPGLPDAGYSLLGFSAYFALQLAVFIVIFYLIPSVNLNQEQDIGFADPTTNAQYIFAFISLVVLAPIAEEFLFRGFVHRRLKKAIGVNASAFIVAGLFGLAHGQLNVAIDVFVLSLVIIYVLEIRDNLFIAIGIHALKNLLAFTTIYFL